MPHFSAALAAHVATHHGVVTAAALTDDGLSAHAVRRLVTTGVLVRCHHGVFRVATAPDTFAARCVAACSADPALVVTGPAAARIWQFRHVWRAERPILLAPHGSRAVTGAVTIRRTNVLDRTDWTMRPDGIRLATPVRTWFDCAQDLDDERFERVTEWVLDRHSTVPTLLRMARRMQARGRGGSARVTRVLGSRPAWLKPADSVLELTVFNALGAAGVEGLVRQHPIQLPAGFTIHADVAVPTIRWALEVDHVTWHGGRLDAQNDKVRDRQARRAGWQVDRITDADVRDDLAGTISELVDLIALRSVDLPVAK